MNNSNQNFPKNNNKPYNDLYNERQQQNYPDGDFYNNDNFVPNEYNQQNDYLNGGQNYQEPQSSYDNNQNQEYPYPQQPQQDPYYPQQQQYPQYPHIDSFPNQQPQQQQYPQYPQYQGNPQGNPYGQFQPPYDPRFQQYPPQQPQPQNLPQSYYQQPQQYPYHQHPQPHDDRFPNQLPYYQQPQPQPNNQYGQYPPQYDPRFQQYPPQQQPYYPQNQYPNYPYPQQPQMPPQEQQPPVQKYANQPPQRRPQPNRSYDPNSIRPMYHPAFFGANYYEKQYKDNYLNSPRKLQQNQNYYPNSPVSDRYNPFLEFPKQPLNNRTVPQQPKYGRPEYMYNSVRPQPVVKPIIPIVEIPVSKPQIDEEVVVEKPVVPKVEKPILKPQIVEEATIEKPVEKAPIIEEKSVVKPQIVVEKPVTPVVEKPVVVQPQPQPVVEKPVVQPQPQPVVQKPVEHHETAAVVEPPVQKSYNPFDEPTPSRFSVPRPQPYAQTHRPPVSAFNVAFPQVEQSSGQSQNVNSTTSNIKLKYEQPSFNIDSVSASQTSSNLYNKVTLKNKLDNMSESKREEFEKSMGVKFVNSDQMPSRKNKGTLIGFSLVLGIGDRFYAGRWFLGLIKFALMVVTLALAGLFAFGFFDKYIIAGFADAEFVASVLLAVFASIWVIWYIADLLLAFLGRQKDNQGRNIDI